MDFWVLGKMNYNEEILLSLCQECGLVIFYKKMKELALDYINLMPLSTEQEELLNYILNAGMYGDVSNRVALNQVKKKGRFRVFFLGYFYLIMNYRYIILV